MWKSSESKKILFSWYNLSNYVTSVEHFFGENSYQICLKCIFSNACSSNAAKMHKIGYMRLPKGSRDACRTAQDGFCLRLGCQLRAKLEPCWPLFPPKTLLWCLLMLLRTARRTSQEPLPPGPMGYPCFGRQEPMGYPCFLVDFLAYFWLIFDLSNAQQNAHQICFKCIFGRYGGF